MQNFIMYRITNLINYLTNRFANGKSGNKIKCSWLIFNKGSNIALQQMRIKRRKESVRLIIFSGYNGEICYKDPCFKKLNFIEAYNYF